MCLKMQSVHETKQRLLEAAGEVFAARGFRAATIREICQRASANVAAVNYHFSDKEGLYFAVMKSGSEAALKKYPPTLGLGPTATGEERLHAFIRSMLFRIADKGQPSWHGKLISHEMANPTKALPALIDKVYKPALKQLEAIVRELVGGRVAITVVRQCLLSILGQCSYFHYARPAIQHIHPEQGFEPADIERLAKHITQFSLAGIRQAAGKS
jgi:TetR/AcrR family transcriptional regulator, regulator of cefoperazone and chloramphenicol sensitivity